MTTLVTITLAIILFTLGVVVGSKRRQTSNPRKVLDRFFDDVSRLDGISQLDIWRILTALRGPDDFEDRIKAKWTTTARIRGLVCGKLSSCLGASTNMDGFLPGDPAANATSLHFINHINGARRSFRRLGYGP